MNRNAPGILLLIGLFCGLLPACTSDNKDLKAYILKIKQKPMKSDSTKANLDLLPNFSFSDKSEGRNPFVESPKKEDLLIGSKSTNANYLLTQCALNTLKFVGLIRQDRILWALIQQPNGEIVRAELGNYLGLKKAKIIAINEDSMQLEETLGESGRSVKLSMAIQTGVV